MSIWYRAWLMQLKLSVVLTVKTPITTVLAYNTVDYGYFNGGERDLVNSQVTCQP